jgi:mannose-binding lectin 2
LKESTENTIKKLRDQEAEDTKRIAELETWVSSKVSERVATTVDAIRDQVDERLTKTVQETAERSSGWKMPFFALVLVLGGVVAGAYKKYQDLRKSHLL